MSATELAKAYVQIVPSADGVTDSLTAVLDPEAERAGQSAGAKLSGGFSGGIASAAQIGVTAIGAIATASTAATGALVSGVGSVAEYGDNIDKMAQKMGMSIESYQEWDAVMKHSGTSMETMKASMKTLANAAESGSDAFEKLGISQEEIASMSQEELFERTISALQNVGDETERTYLAGKTLGRGATELGALLNTSAEDTQAMRDRVRELGGVMSEDAVKAAAAYQDSLQDMQTAFGGLSRGLLAEFLPSITSVMDGLTEIFNGNSEQGIGMVSQGIQSLLTGIEEALPQFAEMATSIVTAIAETFIANLPQIVSAGMDILATLALSVIENMPLIIDAIVGVGEVIVNTLIEYGPSLLAQGVEMLSNLAMGLIEGAPAATENLGEIINQGLALIEENLPGFLDKGIALIEQIADGILENLPAVITNLGEIVTNTIEFLAEHLPEYLQKGIELLQHIGQGIMDNLPEILGTMASVLADIIGTIAEHLPEFLAKGIELLVEVGKGLIEAIPDVLAMLPQVFSDILDELSSYDWPSIGWNLINGIIDGVVGAAGGLVDAAVGAVSDAWNGMIDWLGIASPSKKARDIIGKNWALGIGAGFEIGMPEAERDMTATTRRTMDVLSDTLAGPQSVMAMPGRAYDIDDILAAIESLKQAMMAMQIVLDTGGVVGMVDTALGREAQRAVWQ